MCEERANEPSPSEVVIELAEEEPVEEPPPPELPPVQKQPEPPLPLVAIEYDMRPDERFVDENPVTYQGMDSEHLDLQVIDDVHLYVGGERSDIMEAVKIIVFANKMRLDMLKYVYECVELYESSIDNLTSDADKCCDGFKAAFCQRATERGEMVKLREEDLVWERQRAGKLEHDLYESNIRRCNVEEQMEAMLHEGRYDEQKYIEVCKKNSKLKYSLGKKRNRERALKCSIEDRDLRICKVEAELKHGRTRLHKFTRVRIPGGSNPRMTAEQRYCGGGVVNGGLPFSDVADTTTEPNWSLSSFSHYSSSSSDNE